MCTPMGCVRRRALAAHHRRRRHRPQHSVWRAGVRGHQQASPDRANGLHPSLLSRHNLISGSITSSRRAAAAAAAAPACACADRCPVSSQLRLHQTSDNQITVLRRHRKWLNSRAQQASKRSCQSGKGHTPWCRGEAAGQRSAPVDVRGLPLAGRRIAQAPPGAAAAGRIHGAGRGQAGAQALAHGTQQAGRRPLLGG